MTYDIHLTYCPSITVRYDGEFESILGGFNIDDMTKRVTSCMRAHNFRHADIIDTNTGEVIMIIDARN